WRASQRPLVARSGRIRWCAVTSASDPERTWLCGKESLAGRAGVWPTLLARAALTQAMANQDILSILEQRLGRRHARQRLGIEKDHEAQVFGQGINFFHIENLALSHLLIRAGLMAMGLYWRGLNNAAKVEMKHNRIA